MTLTPFRIEPGEWYVGEEKSLVFTISGTPADVAMRFVVLRQAGATEALLDLSGADVVVSGDNNEIVTVSVDDADYDTLPAGVYWAELWDTDSPLKIAEGTVVLGHGQVEVPAL